jgi:hypothetical protein
MLGIYNVSGNEAIAAVRRKEAEVHTQLDPLATAEQFSDHWI